MSCDSFRTLLSDRLDEPLAPRREQELQVHLALCRSCASLDRDLQAMRGLLASESSWVPEPEREPALFARLQDPDPGRTRSRWLSAALRPLWSGYPHTAVIGALLVGLALSLLETPTMPVPTEPLPAPSVEPGPLVAYPREASLMTVWDQSNTVIVASVDPTGLTGCENGSAYVQRCEAIRRNALERATFTHSAITPGDPTVPPVRIFLYERIVVKG